ncbi:hypothetical protein L6164_016949 [Bauhinia variegata]|uniref:Uncharacterized protein n=1 Tax=Bauhinia variegata TaxID=167791 RepID=A0ACB9N7N0_BAUVA|nr:hypothetical protein L6164_016949 [Bauhinia variegata]
MVSLKQALMPSFPFFLAFTSTVNLQFEDAGIHLYWGQNVKEGTLMETCQCESYRYVSLASLTEFGCNRTPNDAKNVANYLWQFFLSGQHGLALDGVVFDIDGENTPNLYWDDLLRELSAFKEKKKLYFTAVPGCAIPDFHLDKAIKTRYFDFVAPKLYNNSVCEFDGSIYKLLRSWFKWTRYVPSNALAFMTITANPSDNGYIPPNILSQGILPYIKLAPNYGGISVWNRYWDIHLDPSYSDQILPYVSKDVLRSVLEKSNLRSNHSHRQQQHAGQLAVMTVINLIYFLNE